MRRRRALQSLTAIPALAVPGAALAQTAGAGQSAVGSGPATALSRDEQYKVDLTNAEAAAEVERRFFAAEQFEALRKLCAAVFPAVKGMPGAVECEVPEFLDFLVSSAPDEQKELYRKGLDRLAASGVNDQALAPLREPWTYQGPADPIARFLVTAKEEIIRATFNSRVYAAAQASGRRRGAGAASYYWLPAE